MPSSVTRRVRRSTASVSDLDHRAVPVAVRMCGRRRVGVLVGRVVRHRCAPPGDGPDARQELTEAEGLHDVVVGTELEPDDAVDLLGTRGDHDDRDVGTCPQLAAHVEAVAVGETEVEQHDVEVAVAALRASASLPVSTRSTSRPSRSRPLASGVAMASSSSTIRTRMGGSTFSVGPARSGVW